MKKPDISAVFVAAITALLVSCIEPVPPPIGPHFTPNPPYPPQQVDPNAENPQPSDAPPPTENSGSPSRPGEYPTAKPTTNANEVVSPYEPYKIINVEGYKSGELVRDPHNKKIFRVP